MNKIEVTKEISLLAEQCVNLSTRAFSLLESLDVSNKPIKDLTSEEKLCFLFITQAVNLTSIAANYTVLFDKILEIKDED